MEVAHPQSGSSSTWFLVKLEFGNVGFEGEGKTGVPGGKPLGAKERTNIKLNPHMGAGIWTRATLVGGDRSHHCTIPCSSSLASSFCCTCTKWNIIDIFVVVQFCPWFKFYFLLFQTHYHTLSYLKTKKNKIKPRTKYSLLSLLFIFIVILIASASRSLFTNKVYSRAGCS